MPVPDFLRRLASHRRKTNVLFSDLPGFTAFAETAAPDEVMSVLGECHVSMGSLLHHYRSMSTNSPSTG
jgi:adenylate cyclase